jgi:hypothetical protein
LITDTIVAAIDAVERYTEEARALKAPSQGQRVRSELVADFERAERALGMVEHGTTTMATARRGPRELEAQTSIKRGYLNLIHAREAIARHALDAESLSGPNDAAKVGRGSI